MDKKRKPHGYWTKERCAEEAQKYNQITQFQKQNGSAYNAAFKNGWLYDICKHIVKKDTKPRGYWNKEHCAEEALKYKTRVEFAKKSNPAYAVAQKNGWLDDICQHMNQRKPNGYWTYEHCLEESKKYKTGADFRRGAPRAWEVSSFHHRWIEDFTWLEPSLDIYGTPDCIYRYLFKDFNSVYIGRTIRKSRRDKDHIFNKESDPVAKFAYEHGIAVPKMEILIDNISLKEGQRLEEYYINSYKEQGYTILNKAKAGSLGSIGSGKWTHDALLEESKKYKTRTEFARRSPSAYGTIINRGWLDECVWLAPPKTGKKWDYASCYEEAKKYTSKKEFMNNAPRAYNLARKNKWLSEYTWLTPFYLPLDYNACLKEAQKYKNRTLFRQGSCRAYRMAKRNNWLDTFFNA